MEFKEVNDGYIYKFKVEKVWKGNKEEIKNIKMWFGGGDFR